MHALHEVGGQFLQLRPLCHAGQHDGGGEDGDGQGQDQDQQHMFKQASPQFHVGLGKILKIPEA